MNTPILGAAELEVAAPWLPSWAAVSAIRLRHVIGVAALMESWATSMGLDGPARATWRDAGRLHDSLRDADEATLRTLTGDSESAVELLHGPAAALRLAADGEARADLLEAVRFHTVGCARWEMLGRALYMADFLEPGRSFDREKHALLARHVPTDFDSIFRVVLAERLAWIVGERLPLAPETVELWNRWASDAG